MLLFTDEKLRLGECEAEQERQRQIQAQLPNGWVDDMEAVTAYLDEIINAIRNATAECKPPIFNTV